MPKLLKEVEYAQCGADMAVARRGIINSMCTLAGRENITLRGRIANDGSRIPLRESVSFRFESNFFLPVSQKKPKTAFRYLAFRWTPCLWRMALITDCVRVYSCVL